MVLKTRIMLAVPLKRGRVWRSAFAYNKSLCLSDKGNWNTCWKSCSSDRAERCWVMSGSPGTFTISQVRNLDSSCSPMEVVFMLPEFWPHSLMCGFIFVISSESAAEANQDAAFLFFLPSAFLFVTKKVLLYNWFLFFPGSSLSLYSNSICW